MPLIAWSTPKPSLSIPSSLDSSSPLPKYFRVLLCKSQGSVQIHRSYKSGASGLDAALLGKLPNLYKETTSPVFQPSLQRLASPCPAWPKAIPRAGPIPSTPHQTLLIDPHVLALQLSA